MGFLSPWFLAGLAALALPVYIHLLRQHRAQPKPFSSLMFFERRLQSSVRRRRLRYLLLFALRALLVALLALAFANPYIKKPAAAAGAESRLTVIAVDDSFSMRVSGRLEKAKSEAQAVIAGLPPGALAQVVSFGSAVKVLTQPVADRAELEAAVAAIEPSDSRTSYAELARALRALGASAKRPLDVHLISDMQRSGLPASFAELELPEGARMKAHPVAAKRVENWAVESVSAPHRVYDPSKVRVQAVLAGFGTPASRRRASLVVNGRVIESREVEIPASGRAAVEFSRLELPHGWGRAEVRLEPSDALPEDDRYRIAVERLEPRRLLFVEEAGRERAALYFKTALEAASGAAFGIDTASPGQLGNVALGRYAAVVLSDAGSLPEGFVKELREYVRSGGGLLIAAATAAAARAALPVAEGRVTAVRYASREAERFLSAGAVDTAHPVLARVNRLEGVKFFQTAVLEMKGGRVLARLADQSPLLVEQTLGAGRILVFASALDNISNDFPLRASFVPFVEQAANYLAGLSEAPSAYVVDTFYELRGTSDPVSTMEVFDPERRRVLSLAESAKARNIQLASQGFYEIRRANGRVDLAAVNADRRESDLDPLPADAVSLWQNTGQGAVSGGAQAGSVRWSLWWYVMLGVALASLAESVVSARYLGKEKLS